MTTARQRQALGAYGERLAARYLVSRGMSILDQNWRCPAGEIDLVLRDGADVVVCEVKTRRGSVGGPPLAAVGPHKLARLRRLAVLWVEDHEPGRPSIRLDLVGVQLPYRGPSLVEHAIGVG
ncbi:MAG: YraN family protein [Propionibacteriales bacterium]|nr:YraN family protein [Propionibacteriales bacterium]